MKLEEKVPCLDLCKKLWSLGIIKVYDTYIAYVFIEDRNCEPHNVKGEWFLQTSPTQGFEKEFGIRIIPAPDLSEMHKILANGFFSGMRSTHDYFCDHETNAIKRVYADSELNACAKMLIFLKEK